MASYSKVKARTSEVGAKGIVGAMRSLASRFDYASAAKGLEARMIEAKQAGVPVEFNDLGIQSEIFDAQNAWPGLEQAAKSMEAVKVTSSSIMHAQLAADHGDLAPLQGMIASVDGDLDAALSVIERPLHLSPGADWEYPYYSEFGDLSHLRLLARAFAGRAQVRADSGNLEGALSDLEATLQLGEFASRGIGLMASLVNVSIYMVYYQAALGILVSHFEKGHELGEMHLRISRLTYALNWSWAVQSEAFWAIQTMRNLDRLGGVKVFRNVASQMPPRPTEQARTTELPPDTKTAAYLSRILEIWTQVFTEFPGLHSNPFEMGKRIDELHEEFGNRKKKSYDVFCSSDAMFSRAGGAVVNALASSELLKGYGAVLSFRQRTGQWPNSLEDAGVELVDPFDGNPIRYRAEANGFRLWSIGQNLVDDGGVSAREAGGQKKVDIVAMYPPERRG